MMICKSPQELSADYSNVQQTKCIRFSGNENDLTIKKLHWKSTGSFCSFFRIKIYFRIFSTCHRHYALHKYMSNNMSFFFFFLPVFEYPNWASCETRCYEGVNYAWAWCIVSKMLILFYGFVALYPPIHAIALSCLSCVQLFNLHGWDQHIKNKICCDMWYINDYIM